MINWIDPKQARPQNGQTVLCYTKAGYFFTLPYNNGFNRLECASPEHNEAVDMTDFVLRWARLDAPVIQKGGDEDV